MIESIGGIISLFNGLKEGLLGSWETLKKGKKKKVIRKLVVLKITLEDIIETAEEIFSSIEVINQSKRTSKEEMEILKEKIRNQSHNLYLLQINFHDPTSEKILKTFNPELRRNIERLTHEKSSRINYFFRFYDLKASAIRKKYNYDYIQEGYVLLNKLKETSVSFTEFVNEHATIEDII
jgi:hypothetical protein